MIIRREIIGLPTGGVAFTAGTRVKMSSGALAAAGATEADLGTINTSVTTSDTMAPVLLWFPVTRKMIAAGAIDQYADVYRAASGKVNDTASAGNLIGIALQAASADGSQIEVAQYLQPDTDT